VHVAQSETASQLVLELIHEWTRPHTKQACLDEFVRPVMSRLLAKLDTPLPLSQQRVYIFQCLANLAEQRTLEMGEERRGPAVTCGCACVMRRQDPRGVRRQGGERVHEPCRRSPTERVRSRDGEIRTGETICNNSIGATPVCNCTFLRAQVLYGAVQALQWLIESKVDVSGLVASPDLFLKELILPGLLVLGV
jgi:hypothetical protein